MPEFAEALAQPPSLPNLPAAAPAAAKNSGLAIASVILGALGIVSCGITAVVGLVLGIVALAQISRSEGRLKGQGLAIAGVIVSALFLFVMPALLLPALAKAKAKAQGINCMNNVRQITLAVVLHAQANTNACPPAATWCEAIQTTIGSDKVLQCPAGDKNHRCHYAFNAKLDGLSLDQIKNPAQTVLVFETDGGWNLNGGSELLPRKSHHGRGVVVGFADGHVEMVTEARLSQLVWEP
jgi:prepilin-type processing-associated H-X9-DG protein